MHINAAMSWYTPVVVFIACFSVYWCVLAHKNAPTENARVNWRKQLSSQPRQNSLDERAPHSLVAVVVFRFFSDDLLKYNRKDLYEWVTYLKYAGVEHVYMYDNCQVETECQYLQNTSDWTYTLHSDVYMTSSTTPGGQISAYRHFLRTFSIRHTHALFADLDEYPFSVVDNRRNFLQRYVERKAYSQVLLTCRFFSGPAENGLSRPLRYTHTTNHYERRRTKPIVRLNGVQVHNVHKFSTKGSTMIAPAGEMYMRHYWGERAPPGPVQDTSDFAKTFLAAIQECFRIGNLGCV